jgi:acetyl esterase/lipase
VATWSLEYRRIGNPGGGWPGTFADVAEGADHLRVLARTYPLDPNRVIVIGHSAGGHLALWLAGLEIGVRPAICDSGSGLVEPEPAGRA